MYFRWVTFLMGKAAAEWSLFTKPPVSWYQGAVLGIRCIDPLQVFRGVHVLLFLRLFLFSRGMPMQSRFCSPTHKFKSCAWKICMACKCWWRNVAKGQPIPRELISSNNLRIHIVQCPSTGDTATLCSWMSQVSRLQLKHSTDMYNVSAHITYFRDFGDMRWTYKNCQ